MSVNRACKDFEPQLATLAEGGEAEKALIHVSSCPACFAKVESYRQLLRSMPDVAFAPQNWLDKAKAIFPRRTLLARALGTPQVAFRTGLSDRLQVAYEVEGLDEVLRVEYRKQESGWTVLGIAKPDWEATTHGGIVAIEADGRFRFVTESLAHAWVVFETPEGTLRLPPPEAP